MVGGDGGTAGLPPAQEFAYNVRKGGLVSDVEVRGLEKAALTPARYLSVLYRFFKSVKICAIVLQTIFLVFGCPTIHSKKHPR